MRKIMDQYGEKNFVHEPSFKFLSEKLGWRKIEKCNFSRKNLRSVIFLDDFKKALKRLNSWINDDQIKEAFEQLERNFDEERGFSLSINREKYFLLKRGIPVTIWDSSKGGKSRTENVAIIDFENSENNLFSIVSELEVESLRTRKKYKPDLLGFVNGLPLLFAEFKKPSISSKNGFVDNYQRYALEIPQIFDLNAFCIFTNGGEESRIGGIVEPKSNYYQSFKSWSRLSENDKEENEFIEKLLEGVCRKDRFLDLFENFILFREENGEITKIVARNHQYLGVNAIFDDYFEWKKKGNKEQKLGIFRHTQGSGKSYSFIFLTEKMKKTGGSPTFVILLDRTELSNQMYQNYLFCNILEKDKNCFVESKKDLVKKLKEENHSYIFTLIHKFHNDEVVEPLVDDSKEVIIVADEVHRSQYSAMAQSMDRFLPNAKRVGFTATPHDGDGGKTNRRFGPNKTNYGMIRALKENNIVQLFYENRAHEFKYFLNSSEDIPSLERNIGRQSFKKDIWLSGDSLLKNAQDFVSYYSEKFKSLEVGKAIYICQNIATCKKMKILIQKLWEEKAKELKEKSLLCQEEQEKNTLERQFNSMNSIDMRYVVSKNSSEEDEMWEGFSEEEKRELIKEMEEDYQEESEKDLENNFKDPTNPLKIVFVCSKWLTGFDAPCLTYLFLDRTFKDFGFLAQALGRPNRKYARGNKDRGFIIDYRNNFEICDEAIQKFENPLGIAEGNEKILKPIEDVEREFISLILEIELFLEDFEISIQKLVNEGSTEKQRIIISNFLKILGNIERKQLNKFNRLCGKLINEEKYVNEKNLSQEILKKYCNIKSIHEQLGRKLSGEKSQINSWIKENTKCLDNESNFSVELIKDLIPKNISNNFSDIKDIVERFSEEVKEEIYQHREIDPTIEENIIKKLNLIVEDINRFLKINRQKAERKKIEEEGYKIVGRLFECLRDSRKERMRHKDEGFENRQEYVIYKILRQEFRKMKKTISEEDLRNFSIDFYYEMKEYILDTHDPWRERMKDRFKSKIKEELKKQFSEKLFMDSEGKEIRKIIIQNLYSFLKSDYEISFRDDQNSELLKLT